MARLDVIDEVVPQTRPVVAEGTLERLLPGMFHVVPSEVLLVSGFFEANGATILLESCEHSGKIQIGEWHQMNHTTA